MHDRHHPSTPPIHTTHPHHSTRKGMSLNQKTPTTKATTGAIEPLDSSVIPIPWRHGNLHGHPTLYTYFTAQPSVNGGVAGPDELAWAVYAVDVLSYEGRLALARPSVAIWAQGMHTVQEHLKLLTGSLRNYIGQPAIKGGMTAAEFAAEEAAIKLQQGRRVASWFLLSPDNRAFQMLCNTQTSRIECPQVFSMDPRHARGSVAALALIYPLNTLEGAHVLERAFDDLPSLDQSPRIRRGNRIPSGR